MVWASPQECVALAKNIVLCLDGTANQLEAKGNTNVVRLYELLDVSDRKRQVAFYDPGVGTFGAKGAVTPLARWFTRVLGLAFGYGLRTNLAEAYTYLMQTYEPGDRVYVFGFSRGAYTARALCGMVHRAGLLRPGAENLVPYAVNAYARSRRRWRQEDWEQIDRFAEVFSVEADGSRSLPIHFVGLWDTVKAAGLLRWSLKWPYTRQLVNAAAVRHAVSIDERRRPYREYLVHPTEGGPDLREVWFAGVHSDVGGSFDDDRRLGDITLKWMVEHAGEAGLILDTASQAELMASITDDHAAGTIHRMGWVWALLTLRRRPITPDDALVHASVRRRMGEMPGYRPRLPDDARWADPEWAGRP
jgi:uncharacterized protein (DUF2235 family)